MPNLPARQVADPLAQKNFEQIEILLPSLVTTLPAKAVDGQEVYYLADATNGVIWHLRYRSGSSSTYKWEYVGGPPLYSEVAASEGTTSTTYAALATAGPSITVPRAGDYLVTIRGDGFNSGAGFAYMSYDIGATGAVDADSFFLGHAGTEGDGNTRTRLKTGLAASTALVAKYKTNAGTETFRQRAMSVLPVRVS